MNIDTVCQILSHILKPYDMVAVKEDNIKPYRSENTIRLEKGKVAITFLHYDKATQILSGVLTDFRIADPEFNIKIIQHALLMFAHNKRAQEALDG